MIKKTQIVDVLKTCYDPEIPIDLWNLGLIYNIKIDQKKKIVNITMTLTTPGCSMANHMAEDIKQKLLISEFIKEVVVDVTFDPVWVPDMMTNEGKIKLGFKPQKKETNKNWE